MAPLTDKDPVTQDQVSDDDSSSTTSDPLDFSKDEGWEEEEPEEESTPVVDLFSEKVYPDARTMLDACKEKHGFDLLKVKRDLGLDFLGTVRLVNYIRSEVKAGNTKPDVTSASNFAEEIYMVPVMEDDALLFSLDDIVNWDEDESQKTEASRIEELEAELQRIRGEFAEYKSIVKKTLAKEFEKEPEPSQKELSEKPQMSRYQEEESGYFKSYSYNAIHETMLKDTVRTDAYRDFVYDHKGLFKDKVVLDVGCGTGILSMFCARAGAKMVIAVDNSDIIDRARENVFDNGFGDVIKCIRGKIEEVQLPVPQVDVIISEWMGYGLLFEAMFDSVIWARDRYLAPGGLMVPSHATLRIAPLADPDLIDDHISFWNYVYGFKMRSMLLGIYDEALVRTVPASSLAGNSYPFAQLSLHTATVEDLTFIKEFQVELSEDIDALDGFVIWFDMFFMPSPTYKVPPENTALYMKKKEFFTAFTTGPEGPETHWQQTLCLVDRTKLPRKELKKGQVIKGKVSYSKKNKETRSLDIGIDWEAEAVEKSHQEWSIM